MECNLVLRRIKNAVTNQNLDAKLILYGSRSRGKEKVDSDWEILVLLKKANVSLKDEQAIGHKLHDVELETGESISTFVSALNNWNTKLSVTPLFSNVQKDGIYL